MIMAFFIGFSYALGFFNIVSCQSLNCVVLGAAQRYPRLHQRQNPRPHQRQNLRKKLQGLRLNFPKIFFKYSAIAQQGDGADGFVPVLKRGRVQFAQAKEGEMSRSIPSLIGI
jgi:hypothetical protein